MPTYCGFSRVAALLFMPVAILATFSVGRASEDGGPEYEQWSRRLSAAVKGHDAAEEVLCLNSIAGRWRWALRSLPRSTIEQVVGDSELARLGESRVELLQTLYEMRWRYSDGREPSRWWLQLSLALLQRGQPQQANEVAVHVTDPYALIAMQSDVRYKSLARAPFVERDVLKAAQNELERRQTAAEEAPRDLERVVGVARGLLLLHRYDDVVRLTDGVMQRVVQTQNAAPYDGMERQFPWILSVRASAFTALGHDDDAVALRRRAVSEAKTDALSHALNLGVALADLNRPDEALAAMPALEQASPYGLAVAALLRAMAASELNDTVALSAALDELHRAGARYPGMLQRALIVAGRQDEAAAVLISRLGDPDLKAEALVELQDYVDSLTPAKARVWRQDYKALRNRPDVHPLIATQGHIGRYPVPDVVF